LVELRTYPMRGQRGILKNRMLLKDPMPQRKMWRSLNRMWMKGPAKKIRIVMTTISAQRVAVLRESVVTISWIVPMAISAH